ncbi:MAG: hypothetical protein R3B70_05035 [Polyangiaceae bacterium]
MADLQDASSGRSPSFLVASASTTYPYVPPRNPSLDDYNALQWLDVSVRLSIMHGVLDAEDRLRREGKLGHGGSRNLINNQKCRCVNTRAGVYMIAKMASEGVVVNPSSISNLSYYVMVEACEYLCKDAAQVRRLRAWDAHTIAVVSVYQGPTVRPSIVLEYDFWISGAPKVYPGGRGMSSSHEGAVSDDMYTRTVFGAQSAFDENNCSSWW